MSILPQKKSTFLTTIIVAIVLAFIAGFVVAGAVFYPTYLSFNQMQRAAAPQGTASQQAAPQTSVVQGIVASVSSNSYTLNVVNPKNDTPTGETRTIAFNPTKDNVVSVIKNANGTGSTTSATFADIAVGDKVVFQTYGGTETTYVLK